MKAPHLLTREEASRGGQTAWERYGRIPPGRKKLPRLSSKEERLAGSRGGYRGRTTKRKEPIGTTNTRFE